MASDHRQNLALPLDLPGTTGPFCLMSRPTSASNTGEDKRTTGTHVSKNKHAA
jgi:hypothetical protein